MTRIFAAAPRFRPAQATATGHAMEVLRETNHARMQHGAQPLEWDSTLTAPAVRHARDMAARSYFAHQSPDGRDLSDRLGRELHAYLLVGENLAYGVWSARDAVEGWMNSPGHRENLLRPQFNRLGVAVLETAEAPLWVQVFGQVRTFPSHPSALRR